MNTARDVFKRGWTKMKLYFMIGLPTEEDEDVIAIMDTAFKARKIARFECGVKNPTITVSASSFVPKPHTPFQWSAMITLSEIERKQNLLKDYAVKYKLNFRKHTSRISVFEGIVSRGDRRVAGIIYDAWSKGARFDGWKEWFDYDLWMECVKRSEINPEFMLGTIPLDGKLPWDHIDVGLKEKFLYREWQKATKNRLSPPCGKVAGAIVHHSNLEQLEKAFDIDKKKLVCYHCGIACDLKGMVEERREFLDVMDATADEQYVEPEVIKKDIVELREKRGQSLGHKYRVQFSKIGPISFISHLDLQKIMARIFKRAEVEVLYSEGYNARPLISFGPALSLGISSLSEFFDVRVPEEWGSSQKMLDHLNEHSESGVDFWSVEKIEKKAKSIQEQSTAFEYFIPVNNKEKIDEVVSKITSMNELLVKSYSKKKQCDISKDIKPFIQELSKGKIDISEEHSKIIDEVSPCIGYEGIKIVTKVSSGTGIRPRELVDVLTGYGLDIEKPIKTKVYL